jgi:hypothetical protein
MALILVILFAFLFLVMGDLCRIFVVREVTKKAADSASLAVAQNILFFDADFISDTAETYSDLNGCNLTGLKISYDEVVVTVEKKLDFLLLGSIYPDGCTVSSSSCSRIIFPWDEHFGFCKSYKFNY